MNLERMLHEVDAQSPPPPGASVTAAGLNARLRRRRARTAVAIVLLLAPLGWLWLPPSAAAAATGDDFVATAHVHAIAARAALAGWATVSLLEDIEPGRAAALRARLLQDPFAATTRALLPGGRFPMEDGR